ncbi:MAG: heme biosynthesis protein [Gammaproteobacteria bacterium]|jgi:uncharacterized protein HemX|nr:heme biosynthesis protein [Gammaproteobacteria bacterium]
MSTLTLKNKFFTLILSLLLLILIAAVAFFWRQNQVHYENLISQQSSTETALTEIKQTVLQLKEAQASQDDMLHKQEQRLFEVNQFLGQEAQSWQLMRIEYLIQTANDQSVFMHKTKESIALLKAAAQTIKEANLPAWTPLTIAVNKDIDTLNALPVGDFNDILSQLNALDQALNQLPLIIPKFEPPKEAPVPASKTELTAATVSNPREWAWWQIRLNSLWKDLKKMFVIHHNSNAITPILDAQQQAYLRENLHLILFQAKWSLFNQEDALYHLSLNQLTQWINMYFNTENPVTQTVLANLENLQKLQLINTFPSLEGSLSALAEIKKNNPPVVLQDKFTVNKPELESIPHSKAPQNPSSIRPPIRPSETTETSEATDS